MKRSIHDVGERILASLIALVLMLSPGMTGRMFAASTTGVVQLEVTTAEILAAMEQPPPETQMYPLNSMPIHTVVNQDGDVLETYADEDMAIYADYRLESTAGAVLEALDLPYEQDGSILLRMELMSALEGKRLVKSHQSGSVTAWAAVDPVEQSLHVYMVNTGGGQASVGLSVRDEEGRGLDLSEVSALIHAVSKEELTQDQLARYQDTGGVEILSIVETMEETDSQEEKKELSIFVSEAPAPEQSASEPGDESVMEESEASPDDNAVSDEDLGELGEGFLPGEEGPVQTDGEQDDHFIDLANPEPEDDEAGNSGDDNGLVDDDGNGMLHMLALVGEESSHLIIEPDAPAEEMAPAPEIDVEDPFMETTSEDAESGAEGVSEPEQIAGTYSENQPESAVQTYEAVLSEEYETDVTTGDNTVSLLIPANAWSELTVGVLTFAPLNTDSYTVTMDPDNAIEAVREIHVQAGNPVPEWLPTVPEDMTSFVGWFEEDAEPDAKPYDFGAAVHEDLNLVARYSEHYVVQFKSSPHRDARIIHTQMVPKGQVVQPYDPAPNELDAGEGYEFSHWYVEGGEPNQPFAFGNMIGTNLVLVPHFGDVHYVLFQSGGTPVDTQTVALGDYAIKPADPTRKGFAFRHWSLTENGPEYSFESQPVTGTITLYGVWEGEAVPYTLVYWVEKPNLQGQPARTDYVYAYSEVMMGTAGERVLVTAEDARDFFGWRSSANAKEKENALAYSTFHHSDETEILGDGTTRVDLYYNRIPFTITFDITSDDNPEIVYDMDIGGQVHTAGGDAYSITVKYEQDIADLWPTNEHLLWDDPQGTWVLTGWRPPKSIDPNLWATKRLTLGIDMIPSDDSAMTKFTVSGEYSNTAKRYLISYRFQMIDWDDYVEEDYNIHEGYEFLHDYDYSGYIYIEHIYNFSAKTIEGLTPLSYNGRAVPAYDSNENPMYDDDGKPIYALYYLRNQYKLTFNPMGGQNPDGYPYDPQDYWYQQRLEEATEPYRDGYQFVGWYAQPDYFGEPFDFEGATMPASDLTLYARWDSIDNEVKFYKDTNASSAYPPQGVASGYTVDLERSGLPKVGDIDPERGEFLGWLWLKNGAYVQYPSANPVYSDLTLYGNWKDYGFSVTYDLGEASGTLPEDPGTYRLGASAQILAPPGNLDHPDGKVFVGWQIDGNAIPYYPYNLLPVVGPTTLRARYVDPANAVTLTYHPNGGNERPISITVEKDANISLMGDSFFTKDDHLLMGWSDNGGEYNPKDYALGDEIQMEKNTTLYAVWKKGLTFTADSDSKVYDGQPLTTSNYTISPDLPSGYEVVSNVTVSGSITNAGQLLNEISVDERSFLVKDFGGVDVTERFYIAGTVGGMLTVTPRRITITADSDTRSYDGSPHTVESYSVSGLLQGHHIESGVSAYGEGRLPGSYPVVISMDHVVIRDSTGNDMTDNYNPGRMHGLLTITAPEAGPELPWTITANSDMVVYNGAVQTVDGYTTDLPNGYRVSGFTAAAMEKNSGVYPVHIAQPGRYRILDEYGVDVTVRFAAPAMVAGRLEISPVPLTIRADDKTITYGDAAPPYTVSYSGFVGGDTQQVLTTQATASSTYAPGDAVGSYPIIPSGAEAFNYAIIYEEGVLTVESATGGSGGGSNSGGNSSGGSSTRDTYSTTIIADQDTPLTDLPINATDEDPPLGDLPKAGGFPIEIFAAIGGLLIGAGCIFKANLQKKYDDEH